MGNTRPGRNAGGAFLMALPGCLATLVSVSTVFAAATIGIYDDPERTRSSGTMDSNTKIVYLAVQLDGTSEGYTGLECSIAGLNAFAGHLVTWENPPTVVIGSLALDPSTGLGGMNAAWPTCEHDDHFVLRLAMFAPVPPENLVLRVEMRHPPSNPNYTYPFGIQCDSPCFGCHWRFDSIPYVLNPTVGVAPGSWGAVKSLYAH